MLSMGKKQLKHSRQPQDWRLSIGPEVSCRKQRVEFLGEMHTNTGHSRELARATEEQKKFRLLLKLGSRTKHFS